jgi:small ubiquitin-related modifier
LWGKLMHAERIKGNHLKSVLHALPAHAGREAHCASCIAGARHADAHAAPYGLPSAWPAAPPWWWQVYVTPSLTQQQRDQLVQALTQLYTQDLQDASSHAPQLQNAKRAVKGAAEPLSKRAYLGQQQVQQQQQPKQALGSASEVLHVVVQDQMGSEVHFKIKQHGRLERLMQAYVELKRVDRNYVKFVFDSQKLPPSATAADLGMRDGDLIYIMIQQTRC